MDGKNGKQLFSEKALENLRLGKQSELLTNTVSLWNWFFLAALTFFLAAALYWGFFGTMTENVRGLGITVSGGMEAVTARSDGIIQHLNISPGDRVIRNEIIGQLADNRAFYNLKQTEIEYKDLLYRIQTLKKVLADRKTPRQDLERKLEQLQKESELKEQKLKLERRFFRESIWLRSNSTGIVTELLKAPGDAVKAGDHIALLNRIDHGQRKLIAFVPIEMGKKVKPGMSAYFAPGSLKPQDYGYVRGIVQETSQFAVNSDSIVTELKNRDFADAVSKSGVQARLVIEMLPDRATVSGLKWTSRNGATTAVDAGTVGRIIINTRYRSPISYVIPFFREKLFGIGRADAGENR
ncbi:MAG: hypothetical protein V8T90_02550 [Victivallales bacterium]|jgi:hypothetical protein